jgi:hypothetical protein
MEEIPTIGKYLLRTSEEMRIWKVTIEEKPSLKITFKEHIDGVKKKVAYPIEAPPEPMIKILLPVKTIKIKSIQPVLVEREEYRKIKPVIRKRRETISNLNFMEIIRIMEYERKLNEILENISKGRFNLRDAEYFIHCKPSIERLPVDSSLKELYQNIRNVYRLDFLYPVLEGWERVAILNYLNKKISESKNKLKKVIRNEVNIQSDWLFDYYFKRAIEDLLYFGFLTQERIGILRKIFIKLLKKEKLRPS